jgi:thioesterase-3
MTPEPNGAHLCRIKVRGYHLDLYGHVNNARYLEFLEEARWSLMEDRANLAGLLDSGLAFIVVNINIDFKRAATTGDVLEIATSLSGIGNRSMVFRQAVTLAGTDDLVAQADSTFVLVDSATGRAVPIEGERRELIEALGGID